LEKVLRIGEGIEDWGFESLSLVDIFCGGMDFLARVIN
jgi:hypothetical protein